MQPSENSRMSRRELIVLTGVLVVLTLVLAVSAVYGIFTIDENNYMVSVLSLRSGGVEVPGTEGLTRSKELAYFAPQPDRFVVRQQPLASDAPPLYALFALPFSFFGWPGLVWVNILSFVVIAASVYGIVRRTTSSMLAASLAMGTFVLGGYSLEYAQAVWPHMLSAALCIGAFWAAARVRAGHALWYAFVAGVIAGCAAGVREQNIVFAGGIGLGLLVLGPNRLRSSLLCGIGIALPLLVSATVNDQRFGVFHPVPKSNSYVASVQGAAEGPAASGGLGLEPLRVLWTKVVDFSTHPVPADALEARFFHRDQASGAIMTGTVVKKALMQSAPWTAAALLALLAAWIAGIKFRDANARELMALSLIVAPVLAMIAYAGYAKTDGISHNQRYLLEIVPLLAVALGLVLVRISVRPIQAFLGFVSGVVAAFVVVLLVIPPLRYSLMVNVPLALALIFAIAFVLAFFRKGQSAFGLLLGMCVGWAFFVHLNDDIRGVNAHRKANLERTEFLDGVVPDHSAIVAYGGSKDPAGPLQMSKDVVILDAWADGGADAPTLVDELLGRGRRVFVLANLMPQSLLDSLGAGRHLEPLHSDGTEILEIIRPGDAGAAERKTSSD
jgi:hypothetical protein